MPAGPAPLAVQTTKIEGESYETTSHYHVLDKDLFSMLLVGTFQFPSIVLANGDPRSDSHSGPDTNSNRSRVAAVARSERNP